VRVIWHVPLGLTVVRGGGGWGTRSLRGSVCFVDRLEDLGEMATKLPRLAGSIKIVVVERRKGSAGSIAAEYSPLRVRKNNVMAALHWLRKFNPAYQDVTIDEDAVKALPDDGMLPVSTLMVTDEEAEAGGPEPYGAASACACTDYCLRKKECRFGFGEENKLIPFVAIARPGTRIVEEKEAELKINPWDTYLAAMQKKIPDRHGQMQYVSADTLCFDVHAAREDKVCPVWTFWKTRAVWPLDSTEGESYCEDSLMRFKPVRALADVKGNHATYSAAMIAFLEHPHCPAGLQRQVARARLDHDTE
jgi:hypothetical protein